VFKKKKLKQRKDQNMKKTALSLIALSSLLSAEMMQANPFVTHTEMGYIETAGNTETKAFNLESKAAKDWGHHVAKGFIDAQYASNRFKETKNKFLAEFTYDYEFTSLLAFNYIAGYRKDRFSGFESQKYTGPGARYKYLVTEEENFAIDGNLLYAIDNYENAFTTATGRYIPYPDTIPADAILQRPGYQNNYMAFRVKGAYDKQLLENLKFDQEVTYRSAFKEFQNFFVFSKTALSSRISEMFSAGISYKVDYINVPANGKDKVDTTFSANLILDY